MEFDGLETVVANHQLARRMTDTSSQPLHLQLLPADSPAIAQLAAKLKGESYEIFLRQPLSEHFFRQFLLLENELEQADFLKQADTLHEFNSAEERRQSAKEMLDMFFNSTAVPLAPAPQDTDETKSGNTSRSTTPRSSRKKSSVKGTAPVFDRQASANSAQAFQAESKRLVQVISQRLEDEAQETGPDIFVELVALVQRRFRTELYPRFLASDGFVQYVRHREYAARGKVTINSFITYRVVGRGAFGAVSAVSKIDTHCLYALKEMSKRQIKAQDCLQTALNERNILTEVDSPFTTRLRYAFQNEESLFFVMDFCSGGDLKWHLRNSAQRDAVTKLNHFSEDVARFYVAETLLALEHVHSRGIVYRDLKPHNLLLNANGHVVLSDFGLAEKLSDHRSGKLHALAGTAGYWAPEVLMKVPYGTEADIWSFGILLYCFIVGERPKCKCKKGQWCTFVHSDEKSQETLARDQELAAYNYDIQMPESMSPEAADLIRRCLEVDQQRRISLAEIKKHPFFKSLNWKALSNLHVHPPYVPDASQVHADSLAEVGELETSKFKKTKLEPDDENAFTTMEFYSEQLVQQEIAQALEKQGQRRDDVGQDKDANEGCCVIL